VAKAEISWVRRNEEGEKLQVYAQRIGGEWFFFERSKRYDQWQPVAEPPLEDWLELLDAVRRRINRRKHQPQEETRIVKRIRESFPEAEF
jgi:hypothetical protein